MPDTPKNAKKPADHKKATGNTECFTFTHDGVEHTLSPTYDVLTPGFLRANRRRGDLDAFFTMLEELADADALAAIDSMSRVEFDAFSEALNEHLEGISRGE